MSKRNRHLPFAAVVPRPQRCRGRSRHLRVGERTSWRWLVALAVVLMLDVAQAQSQSPGGFDAAGQCVGDRNGDGQVSVDEIVTAVNNALNGCAFSPVTLQFRAQVGSETFACGNIYHGIGTSQADIVPSDFRFYIHNIRLVTADGREVALRLDQDGVWQNGDVVLLDFENKVRPCNNGTPQTNGVVKGTIAPGTYTGLRFTLGVPFNRNHADAATAPSPLNLSGMFWSWQDGYKFLRIDTAFDNLRVHLGSVGCYFGSTPGVVVGCTYPNRAEVDLPNFDPATNVVVADLAALLADSDLNVNQPDTPPGCMSDPNDSDCNPIFRNLGLHFSDGTPSPATQKFFRVE
jgi:uncharacterized repeat protein (TIGR04052 family)